MRTFRLNKFWYSVSTLVGSAVGIGFYGIPFSFQKAGFGLGLLFLIGISSLVLFSNLLYGEIVLRTHQRHQLVGYVHKYLGPWSRRVNLLSFWVSFYGSLIGIIIISGNFLTNIFSFAALSPVFFSTVFVIVAAVLVLMGLRSVSKFDFFMMLLFVFIVALIGVLGAGHIHRYNFSFAMGNFWFLPFGIILFAMNSSSGIPLAREILVGEEDKFRKAVMVGTLIPAALYFVFTLLVLGISGDITSPDAISGLRSFLGGKIVFVGSVFGFLTSSTIFLNLATALKKSFQEDFHFSPKWAWFLVVVPPYLLFLSGIRNFIDIIDLVGGMAVSIEVLLLVFMYVKARKAGDRVPEYSFSLPNWIMYATMGVLAFGAAYTLIVK